LTLTQAQAQAQAQALTLTPTLPLPLPLPLPLTLTLTLTSGGRSAGVLVFEFGRGTFADNDIHDNRGWNVEVRRNSCPTFERNKVHGGHPGGFYCHGDGDEGDEGYCLPTLDHNEVYANAKAAMRVYDYGKPTVTANRIYDGRRAGAY